MRYKLVIFDFDGTLADSFPWFMNVLNDFAKTYRFRKVEAHEVEALRRSDSRQIIRHLGIPSWKIPWIARGMRRRLAQDIDQIRPFAGVPEMLGRLSAQGIELGLVTSNSKENVLRVLGPENAARFRYFRCGVSMFGKRPQLRKVIRAAGVSPGDALYVGDETRDLEAAHAEGMRFGAVAWGYADPEILRAAGADQVFEKMEEL